MSDVRELLDAKTKADQALVDATGALVADMETTLAAYRAAPDDATKAAWKASAVALDDHRTAARLHPHGLTVEEYRALSPADREKRVGATHQVGVDKKAGS